MKIKNVSQQELKIAVPVGQDILTSKVKPNQVMYCEKKSAITKQLVILERKKLIVIDKDMNKPDYVDNYKPYYESGTYIPQHKVQTVDIDDVLDEDEIEDEVIAIEPVSDFDFADDDSEPEAQLIKKGRGRPRKPVEENAIQTEKKKRGRPKGTTKKK